MPNWCENQLTIVGPKEDMKPFMEVIAKEGGEYSLLESLYPTPPELLDTVATFGEKNEQHISNKEKYGHTDWYSWRIEHWGTKWTESDLYANEEYNEDEAGIGTISFMFNTAWAPPIEAFDKIAIDYPKLAFCIYYEEHGMAFCGKNIWAKGECQESQSSELVSNYFDPSMIYECFLEEN